MCRLLRFHVGCIEKLKGSGGSADNTPISRQLLWAGIGTRLASWSKCTNRPGYSQNRVIMFANLTCITSALQPAASSYEEYSPNVRHLTIRTPHHNTSQIHGNTLPMYRILQYNYSAMYRPQACIIFVGNEFYGSRVQLQFSSKHFPSYQMPFRIYLRAWMLKTDNYSKPIP